MFLFLSWLLLFSQVSSNLIFQKIIFNSQKLFHSQKLFYFVFKFEFFITTKGEFLSFRFFASFNDPIFQNIFVSCDFQKKNCLDSFFPLYLPPYVRFSFQLVKNSIRQFPFFKHDAMAARFGHVRQCAVAQICIVSYRRLLR